MLARSKMQTIATIAFSGRTAPSDANRSKLSEPKLYLTQHRDELVILDEVHRLPDLFQHLRRLIDKGHRAGRRSGQFLLLAAP